MLLKADKRRRALVMMDATYLTYLGMLPNASQIANIEISYIYPTTTSSYMVTHLNLLRVYIYALWTS